MPAAESSESVGGAFALGRSSGTWRTHPIAPDRPVSQQLKLSVTTILLAASNASQVEWVEPRK